MDRELTAEEQAVFLERQSLLMARDHAKEAWERAKAQVDSAYQEYLLTQKELMGFEQELNWPAEVAKREAEAKALAEASVKAKRPSKRKHTTPKPVMIKLTALAQALGDK